MNFSVQAPDHVWVSDVTEFKLDNKKYYICVILDLYARKVIAYRISPKHSTQLITGTFKLAYATRHANEGLVFHSDRGAQYTSHSFRALLKTCHVNQSFSPAGKPRHNAVMFSNMKKEELYRTNCRSVGEFKKGVDGFIESPHSTLNNKTPNAYECLYYDRKN